MTLLEVIDSWETQDQDAPLLSFCDKGAEVLYTRASFRARAWSIAAHISEHAAPGERALLVFPPGLEFLCAFFGCLSAGVTAVPVYPPDRRPQSLSRFQSLIRDSRPAVVLGTSELCAQLGAVPELAQIPRVSTDRVPAADAQRYVRPDLRADALAFLQYTSGSTGTPRGVMHTHRNILANMEVIRRDMGVLPSTHGVIWLPLYHDMGLITTLVSMRHGEQLSLMSPISFLKDPVEWVRIISRVGASHSGGPNFAFDLCARKARDEDVAQLNLSSWTRAYNGAEPIRTETLDRFVRRFGPCGFSKQSFMPCYGLAESTLMVSVCRPGTGVVTCDVDDDLLGKGRIEAPRSEKARHELVSSGPAGHETEIVIANPQTLTRAAAGEVGEIWVRSPSLGVGYWARPEETESMFNARLLPDGDGPFLRTGDLGFLERGQLFVTGRIKDMIIVRGHNYYPHDIELIVANAHPAIRHGCCVATAVAGVDGEELAVILELDERKKMPVSPPEVLSAVRAQISENFGLAPIVVAIVGMGSIPKTSSGKLQRSACRAAFLANELPVTAAHDLRAPVRAESAAASPAEPEAQNGAAQAKLLELVTAHLIREIANAVKVAVDEKSIVTQLGINSVTAIDLMFSVEKEFGIQIGAEQLTDSISVAELARRIVYDEHAAPARVAQSEPCKVGRPSARGGRRVDFSLMYFSTDTLSTEARYDVLLQSARFADDHGFTALWVPERHFHAFGGTYPNPAVAAAALAVATKRIRLRAGSVVAPLHHPIRIAEEWSLVDNLSNGRVDLAFATGWNPNDFVLAPEKFAERRKHTLDAVQQVRKAWRGEATAMVNGKGESVPIAIHPAPVQKELNLWMTCTSDAEGFIEAGRRGYNVLTALLFQRVEHLAEKLELYRNARSEYGHDPEGGVVTLMLHTFLGPTLESVRRRVAQPFKRYLESSVDLWRHEWADLAKGDGVSKELLDVAFERYTHGNTLIGTPKSCAELVGALREIGVSEIACLIDFGVPAQDVLQSLVYLDDLRALLNESAPEAEERGPIAAMEA